MEDLATSLFNQSLSLSLRECQQQDWASHRLHCRSNIRTPIALPFVISLPITSLTYDKIAEKAELYAR